MPLTFPIGVWFNPESVKLSLVGNVITSPNSISGVGQAIATDGGGYRTCQMTGIGLRTADQIRAWEAWQGHMSGGVVPVNVPVASNRTAPRGVQGRNIARYGSLHSGSDDRYFPEATGYGSRLVIADIAAAAYRAMQVTITISRGSRLFGGEVFSINHQAMGHRVYKVTRILSRNGQTATVVIDCPLRQAIAGGTTANFDWPMFQAILVPQSDISLDLGVAGGQQSITFREAF